MSLEEKTKYGYGFDLDKYKIDPGYCSYYRLMDKNKKRLKRYENKIKKEPVSSDIPLPEPPKLLDVLKKNTTNDLVQKQDYI